MPMSDMSRFGVGAGLGGIGAGLGAMFMGQDQPNPYDSAKGYFDQIPGAVSPYMQQYQQSGSHANNALNGAYSDLLTDPTRQMNAIGNTYHQSPGFQFQMQQGMNGVNNAAASGGMSGTPSNMYNAANMSTGLANQDYYNYLNHGLAQYDKGMSGFGELNNQGYQANNFMGETTGNALMNQGNLAFSGQAAQNQSQGQGMGNLLGSAASLAAFIPGL